MGRLNRLQTAATTEILKNKRGTVNVFINDAFFIKHNNCFLPFKILAKI